MPYFKAKCTKFDFGWGAGSGETRALPILLAGFKGSYFYSKPVDGAGRGGKGKGIGEGYSAPSQPLLLKPTAQIHHGPSWQWHDPCFLLLLFPLFNDVPGHVCGD